jgi:hypothetical protein
MALGGGKGGWGRKLEKLSGVGQGGVEAVLFGISVQKTAWRR